METCSMEKSKIDRIIKKNDSAILCALSEFIFESRKINESVDENRKKNQRN